MYKLICSPDWSEPWEIYMVTRWWLKAKTKAVLFKLRHPFGEAKIIKE